MWRCLNASGVIGVCQILRAMSEQEKRLFLKFVWGRSRLPLTEAQFTQQFRLTRLNHSYVVRTDLRFVATKWASLPPGHACAVCFATSLVFCFAFAAVPTWHCPCHTLASSNWICRSTLPRR